MKFQKPCPGIWKVSFFLFGQLDSSCRANSLGKPSFGWANIRAAPAFYAVKAVQLNE